MHICKFYTPNRVWTNETWFQGFQEGMHQLKIRSDKYHTFRIIFIFPYSSLRKDGFRGIALLFLKSWKSPPNLNYKYDYLFVTIDIGWPIGSFSMNLWALHLAYKRRIYDHIRWLTVWRFFGVRCPSKRLFNGSKVGYLLICSQLIMEKSPS